MGDIHFVISKVRLVIVTMLIVVAFISIYNLPKNQESNKMIIEYNDKNACEVLMWNGDELVARLYSDNKQECKFYLLKNSSR